MKMTATTTTTAAAHDASTTGGQSLPAAGSLAPEPPAVAPLGQPTARGFVWLVGQTLASKVTSLLGQLVLTWLLDPADFGLVGLALTVSAVATIVQQVGLKEILIQRQRHLARWATAAFWMSLALGCVASALMLAVAPVAARLYEAPQLPRIILWIAAAAPLSALSTLPAARLHIQLRFRAIAGVNFAVATATTLLSVLFAWRGFGAYSFVMPMPFVAAGQAAGLWWLSRPTVSRRLHVRRWRYLASDSAWVLAAYICYTAFGQGDYVVLGMFYDKHVVGQYYFAFNLSTQAVSVFAINLWGVLLPALSKLQDNPVRQLAAFMRACRALSALAVPCCLAQAALAGPLVRLFFAAKWEPAIPILQLLSVGMALMVVGSPGASLLQSRGRFRTLFFAALGSVIGFFVLITIGTSAGGVKSVALAVAVFYAIYGPVNLYIGVRDVGGTWRHVAAIYVVPFSSAIIAIGCGAGVARLVPAVSRSDVLTIIVVLAVAASVYTYLLRRLIFDVWQELAEKLRRGAARTA
jgi:PST family polysaccharide transporter